MQWKCYKKIPETVWWQFFLKCKKQWDGKRRKKLYREFKREYQTKNCEHEENLKREKEFFIIAVHNRCIRAVSK